MESIWISVLIVCVLYEFMSLNLYTIFGAVGALAAWIMTLLALPIWIVVPSFVVLTAALILLARPALAKWLLPPKITYRQDSYETTGHVKDE